MSLRELYEWYDYYSEEPFFADRLEIQMANVCTMVGSFGGSKAKHNDYMVRRKEEKVQSVKEFEDDLKARFMPFAKKQ
jgi:hypothetical protein